MRIIKKAISKTSSPCKSLVTHSPVKSSTRLAESIPAAGITFAELHEDFLLVRRGEGIRPATLRPYRGSLLTGKSGAPTTVWRASGRC